MKDFSRNLYHALVTGSSDGMTCAEGTLTCDEASGTDVLENEIVCGVSGIYVLVKHALENVMTCDVILSRIYCAHGDACPCFWTCPFSCCCFQETLTDSASHSSLASPSPP